MACVKFEGFHLHCTPVLASRRSFANSSSVIFPSVSSSKRSVRNENKKGLRVDRMIRASGDRVDLDENPEGIISGEWPENLSLLTYEDLRAHLEPTLFKEKMKPSSILGEVMSTTIRTTTVDETLEEIHHHFEVVSGLPVVGDELICIGVISKKDKQRASNGLKSKVGEVMSTPAITLPTDKTVLDAAALMLKEKIHRIPIVNRGGQVVGIVTRTDIFKALESLPV